MLKKTLLIASLISVFALLMIGTLPKPDVVLSVSSQTQTFEYRVFNRNSSSLLVRNARIVSIPQNPFDNDPSEKCLSGEIIFDTNVIVKFWRGIEGNPQAVAISFPDSDTERMGEIITANEDIIELKRGDIITLDPTYEPCRGDIPNNISIWGDGALGSLRTVGSAGNPQSSDLLGGQVTITARAVERLFKVFKGAEGLYEAGAVSLPFGARLESDGLQSGNKDTPIGQWVGIARPIVKDGVYAFQVDFSTDDQRVWLYRPGVRNAGTPDPIGAAAFVSQTKDPGVIRFQVFIAAIFLILQTIASLVQTINIKPETLFSWPKLPKRKKSESKTDVIPEE